jgi:hypothetical protein
VIGPPPAPVSGFGGNADLRADFLAHFAGFGLFGKAFSAREQCAKPPL